MDNAAPASDNAPIRDMGSFVSHAYSDKDIKDHRSQATVYIGLQLPNKRRHRNRRHHRKSDSAKKLPTTDIASLSSNVSLPSQRVQFLLGEEEDDLEHKAHDLFCEMAELLYKSDGEMEWKECARWVKFEEDVEDSGGRWSKPHVATLSLHSIFELRCYLLNGTVVLDMDSINLEQVTGIVVDHMVASKQLEENLKDQVREVLLSRHWHQNEKRHRRENGGHHGSSKLHLPSIRSLADIGRKSSEPKNLSHHGDEGGINDELSDEPVICHDEFDIEQGARGLEGSKSTPLFGRGLFSENSKSSPHFGLLNQNGSHEKVDSMASSLQPQSSAGDLPEVPSSHRLNLHFMKKIPPGAESANILIGEVDFLNHPIVAFVRLSKACLLADLTEVPVPTRFMFFLLGPKGNQSKFHEVGRSIATLMSDEVFHDVAYHAKSGSDLLAGIDEFLDQVTVLPPGEWDPSIRIEPPKTVPSQEGRKVAGSAPPLPNGKAMEEEDDHTDPSLKRSGRFFGGLIADIKRKAPFYTSDFKDALSVQCIASFVFLYFACLTPIITFGGLLEKATDLNMAAMESLLAGAICGITYAFFSGQPLTILGSTGPVLVFESILNDFCKDNDMDYMSFRLWIGVWTGLILIIIVAFDLSALVRFITRFTEESFAALISLIFIKEAISKLIDITFEYPIHLHPPENRSINCICVPPTVIPTTPSNVTVTTAKSVNFSNIHISECEDLGGSFLGDGCVLFRFHPDVFFLSGLLFLGTFALSMALKSVRTSSFLPTTGRVFISDFAVLFAIFIMVGVDLAMGIPTPKLNVPHKFAPTSKDRDWFIPPLGTNPWWTIIAAVIPALLATILIFMDQQITAVIVNRKENKLKKGAGYHLDLLIVAVLIIINSILGLPWFVAATVLSINHVMSLKLESKCAAPGERPKFLGVREQRVTGITIFLFIGLSVTMTRVLQLIPMPVLYGVFLYMGVASLKGMQLVDRVLLLFMPTKYQPDYMYLRHVRTRRVHMFTFVQIFCLAVLWVVKTIKEIKIAFPIMVLAICFVRKGMDWIFEQKELKWLDDVMPEYHRREKEDAAKKQGFILGALAEHTLPFTLAPVLTESEMDTVDGEHIPMGNTGGDVVKIPIAYSSADFDNVNISEEMAKTSIWKSLVSNESNSSLKEMESETSSGSKKHGKRKKHSKKNLHESPKDDKLPTIPASPEDEEEHTSGRSSKKKNIPVSFYIDEEEKEQLIHTPSIMVDPPSDTGSSSSINKKLQ